MLQKIYEFLLYHSIDNIKLYNFLVQAFPKQEKCFIERTEKEITPKYLTEDEVEQMREKTWERICVEIREKHGKDAL